MPNSQYFVTTDINQYLEYIQQVRNLSINTVKSYSRDLAKLSSYFKSINISSYDEVDESVCSVFKSMAKTN